MTGFCDWGCEDKVVSVGKQATLSNSMPQFTQGLVLEQGGYGRPELLAIIPTLAGTASGAVLTATSFLSHHPGSKAVVAILGDDASEVRLQRQLPRQASIVRFDRLIDRDILSRLILEWDAYARLRILGMLTIGKMLAYLPINSRVLLISPWVYFHNSLEDTLDIESSLWAVTLRQLMPFPIESVDKSIGYYGLSQKTERVTPAIEGDSFFAGSISADILSFEAGKSEPVIEWLCDRMARSSTHPSTWTEGLADSRIIDRWFDVADRIYPARISRHPGINIGAQNAGERLTSTSPDGALHVSGHPIISTSHYGYDPHSPWDFSQTSSDTSPWNLADDASYAALWEQYGEMLIDVQRRLGTSFAVDDFRLAVGVRISPETRWSLRFDGLRRVQGFNDASPDRPFMRDGQALLEWLRENSHRRGHPLGQREARLIAIMDTQRDGNRASNMDSVLDTPLLPGVDVLGPAGSISGVGAAARRLVAVLDQLDIPSTVTDIQMSENVGPVEPTSDPSSGPKFDVCIVVANGDSMFHARRSFGIPDFDRRYIVGQWAWETESLPVEHRQGFSLVDEIWANSKYVQNVIQRAAPDDLPVHMVPPFVETPQIDNLISRSDLGIPNEFIFLFLFDYLSSLERKNAIGLVRSFRSAFRPGEGPVLCIKTTNARRRPSAAARLRWESRDRSDILILDGFLPSRVVHSLMSLSDAYVSLHRSEGLGFTMAEAMLLGKPVIATNYGGNTDFMTAENSLLVPAERASQVFEANSPYRSGSEWANPDLDVASDMMRHVATNATTALELGRQAKADALRYFDLSRVASIVDSRISAIRSAL